MSFGLSGQIDRNTMIGGDVVVAWIDHETLNGYAYDYYLDAKSQCAGNHGSCPDVKLSPNTENIRLLNAALVNGYSIVTYQRPLKAYDEFDLPIYTNGSQAIIWAIGPLNSLHEVSYHSISSKATTLIDFGRPPQWNCPIPESDASVANSDVNDSYENSAFTTVGEQATASVETTTKIKEQKEIETTKITTRKQEATPAPVKAEKPWDIPAIQCYEPEDGIFYAQMGPTGGKRGYSAITGHVGWGISWYINGLLIPEINVVRGRSYTFVVEGGLDPEIPAKYHPFYITDDPIGGYLYKTPEERAKIRVFAGITQNKAGEIIPTGTGRLCNWTPDPDQPPADEFASFGAYQRTLSLVCDHGEPGVVQWMPDDQTPDTVYYQCFSHRYLGWKINVHNSCDKEEAESEQVTTRIYLDEDNDRPDEPLLTNSNKVEIRMKASNISTNGPNSLYDKQLESKNKPNLNLSKFKDIIISDYSENEQYILQDPYLPPPPYQKNFDYQSMQTTEPLKEIKTITETVAHKEFSKIVSPGSIMVKPTAEYITNTSKTYLPQQILKHKNHLHKEPYLYKAPTPIAQFEYQVPAMHIQVFKHPSGTDTYEPSPQKLYTGRPLRHSIMFKKPVHKVLPYSNYAVRPYHNIQAKPLEPSVSGSIPIKSVITPPSRTVIPKQASTKLISHPIPQSLPKKPFINRKREELKPKSQQLPLTNRVEDYLEHKYPGSFNPNSIVIEGGFKPILPNSGTAGGVAGSIINNAGNTAAGNDQQNVAQERMSEDAEDYTEQDFKEPAIAIAATITSISTENSSTAIDKDYSKNPFAGAEPEQFEPIFIPSPVIDEKQRKKKPSTIDQHQHFKVKLQTPEPKIAYVWPNKEVIQQNSHSIRDIYYDFNVANKISSHQFKGYDKFDSLTHASNPIQHESSHSSTKDDSNHAAEHHYATEAVKSSEKLDSEHISGQNSKYKVKYIPVGYAVKDSMAENLDSKPILTATAANDVSTNMSDTFPVTP